MKLWSVSCVAALIMGALFAYGCNEEQTYTLYFQSQRNGNWDIYSIQHDGTQETQITDHVTDDLYPAVSPDGTKLAFIRRSGNATDIFLINVDEGGEQDLTNGLINGTVESLAWYPDGQRLLVALSSPLLASGLPQLYWMDVTGMRADGTGINLLGQDPTYAYNNPRISPNGEEIVVTASRPQEGVDIHVLDSAGRFIRVIPQETFLRPTGEFRAPDSIEDFAEYAPNGRDVILQSNSQARTNPNRSFHLWYVSSQGRRSLDRTPDAPSNSTQPAWSTALGSSTIAFVSDEDGDNEIYLWNLDDDESDPIQLTNNSVDDAKPTWLRAAPVME